MKHPYTEEEDRYGARPATRIGRTVIYEGGAAFRLKFWPYVWCALGFKRNVYASNFVKGAHP